MYTPELTCLPLQLLQFLSQFSSPWPFLLFAYDSHEVSITSIRDP